MRGKGHRRSGFTLIELLVVIGIILVLSALTAGYFLFWGRQPQVNGAVDRVQQTLLIAKQTARRDGQPVGVRFNYVDFIDSNGIPHKFCQSLTYIRQPDDFAQGVYIGRVATAPHVAIIFSTTNLLDTNVFPLQAGDYIEFYGGGLLRRVAPPQGQTYVVSQDVDLMGNPILNQYRIYLAPPPPLDTGLDLPDDPITPPTGLTVNYRIVPQPRPQPSEPVIVLPEDTVIDFTSIPLPTATPPGWTTYLSGNVLSNPPVRMVGNVPTFEILFGPSGAVIGQNTTAGMIFLWVRGARMIEGGTPSLVPDNSTTATRISGKPILIAVQTRTGFIAAHSIPAAGDPYTFARDGKASGM